MGHQPCAHTLAMKSGIDEQAFNLGAGQPDKTGGLSLCCGGQPNPGLWQIKRAQQAIIKFQVRRGDKAMCGIHRCAPDAVDAGNIGFGGKADWRQAGGLAGHGPDQEKGPAHPSPALVDLPDLAGLVAAYHRVCRLAIEGVRKLLHVGNRTVDPEFRQGMRIGQCL